MAPKAAEKLAHELLTKARDEGGSDAAWEEIFEKLREEPAALVRPAVRKLTLLHQAAYWGRKVACETLVNEFGADPKDVTADGEAMDASMVAASQEHMAVAAVLAKLAAKKPAAKKVPAPSRVPAAPSPADEKLAHELLNLARDKGAKAATWTGIFTKLKTQPLAQVRPKVRKYSLLHQAAHWGQKAAVEKLVKEFGADPKEPTADGEDLTAAGVALSQGHKEVADLLEALAAGSGSAADDADAATDDDGPGAEATSSAAEVVAEPEDLGKDAPSPYAPDKASSSDDAELKDGVFSWMCLRGVGKERQWELYDPSDTSLLEAARAGGADRAELDGRVVDLGELKERRLDDEGAPPRKVCCFKVIWEWDTGEGGKAAPIWQAYPPEAQWQLEYARCGSCMTSEVVVAPGKKYLVDLVGLRQHSTNDSFRTRRVRRRGVPLRVPYPPQVRDVSSDTWIDLTWQPDYWSAGAGGFESNEAKRMDLPKDSPIVARINEWMNSTVRSGHAAAYGQVPGSKGPTRGMEVVRVEVVQQPALWRRYLCYREKMKLQKMAIMSHAGTTYLKKNPMAMPKCEWLDNDVNEAYFWHGSGKSPDGTVDLIDAIVSVGHEPSDENSEVMEVSDGASSRFAKNTSMFGSGVYLADISSKANLYVPCSVCHQGSYFRGPCGCSKAAVDKAPPYRMLLCRAVLGRVYVERKYSEARYKGEFNPAKNLGVDSVMGEALKGQLAFREYVVYNDHASYPEFIVHYKRLGDGPFGFGFGFGGGKKKKAKLF